MITIISQAIKQGVSDTDKILRLGGDEFLIIFPGCSETEAVIKVENIKLQLSAMDVHDEFSFDLSFSYGVVGYQPSEIASVEAFIAQADQLMYQNKKMRL